VSWELPQEAFTWLEGFLQPHWTVVEFGSGAGSLRLASMCSQLYSVEHNPHFVRKDDHNHMYIYAAIRNGWYNTRILDAHLPKAYDFILIDGPPGSIGRSGILKYPLLDVPMLIDDTHRPEERRIACQLATRAAHNLLVFHDCTEGRQFATIT